MPRVLSPSQDLSALILLPEEGSLTSSAAPAHLFHSVTSPHSSSESAASKGADFVTCSAVAPMSSTASTKNTAS